MIDWFKEWINVSEVGFHGASWSQHTFRLLQQIPSVASCMVGTCGIISLDATAGNCPKNSTNTSLRKHLSVTCMIYIYIYNHIYIYHFNLYHNHMWGGVVTCGAPKPQVFKCANQGFKSAWIGGTTTLGIPQILPYYIYAYI